MDDEPLTELDRLDELHLSELSFTPDEYARRTTAVRARMTERNIRFVVLTDPTDVEYITGFVAAHASFAALALPITGTPQFLVSLADHAVVCARSWVKTCVTYEPGAPMTTALLGLLHELEAGELELRGESATLDSVGLQYSVPQRSVVEAQRQALVRGFPHLLWPDASTIVADVRVTKSLPEINRIETALRWTEAALDTAVMACVKGASENNVVAAMTNRLLGGSASSARWPTYHPRVLVGGVAATAGTGIAGRVITGTFEGESAGQLVLIDCGACCDGYTAAEQRTVFVGEVRPWWLDTGEALVNAAIDAQLRIMKVGTTGAQLYAAACDVLDQGMVPGSHLSHMGNSVGLGSCTDGADSDFQLTRFSEVTLKDRMVLSLNPAIQTPWGLLAISVLARVGARRGVVLGKPTRSIVSVTG